MYDLLHFFQEVAYMLSEIEKKRWKIWSKHDVISFVSKDHESDTIEIRGYSRCRENSQDFPPFFFFFFFPILARCAGDRGGKKRSDPG